MSEREAFAGVLARFRRNADYLRSHARLILIAAALLYAVAGW